jgi:hypothetical protein
MINIHVVPTDKPSRLYVDSQNNICITDVEMKSGNKQHIYITSDEEIKEGDWIFSLKTNNIFKADSIEYLKSHNMIEDFDKSFYINSKSAKKIILTTDQDLIKNGVQAIDDEFLEWFVKNPSCEFVKTFKFADSVTTYTYKIIIPQEEPKQDQLKIIYSEEEVLDMLKFFTKNTRGDKPWVDADDEWFTQFKKK